MRYAGRTVGVDFERAAVNSSSFAGVSERRAERPAGPSRPLLRTTGSGLDPSPNPHLLTSISTLGGGEKVQLKVVSSAAECNLLD